MIIRNTDVVFLHSDDRATIRYTYSKSDLREGLLLHILYFGRAIIPINFLLANPQFDDLYSFKGSISNESEIYKLIKSGDVIPLMFDDDYIFTSKKPNIREYSEYSLEKGILLPCSVKQWRNRSDLLGEMSFASPPERNFRSLYRETLLNLLTNEGVHRGYFGSLLPTSKYIINHLYKETAKVEHPTRSHTYRLIDKAHSKKLKEALKIIADAAYYAAFTDATKSNPAIPHAVKDALLAHYWHTGSPLIFEQEKQTVEVIGEKLPDFGHLSLPEVINDLRNIPLRKQWLKALQNAIRKDPQIDPMAQKLKSTFTEWTHFLVDYFSTIGPKKRETLIKKQRWFFKQTQMVQVASDVILLLGAGISTYYDIQNILQGKPSLTSLISLLLFTGIKLGLRESKKRIERSKPTYGSIIPMTKTFTPKGEHFGTS